MISVKDRWRIYRLKAKLEEAYAPFKSKLKKAEEEGGDEVIIAIIDNEMRFCGLDYVYDIESIHTRELISQAKKYYIEIPTNNDKKMWENYLGTSFLTDHGKATISKKIKACRRENIEFRMKQISILIGLIGALTGLVAVINK